MAFSNSTYRMLCSHPCAALRNSQQCCKHQSSQEDTGHMFCLYTALRHLHGHAAGGLQCRKGVRLAFLVNIAVVTVTTTGRCTSAHKGMLTCTREVPNLLLQPPASQSSLSCNDASPRAEPLHCVGLHHYASNAALRSHATCHMPAGSHQARCHSSCPARTGWITHLRGEHGEGHQGAEEAQ